MPVNDTKEILNQHPTIAVLLGDVQSAYVEEQMKGFYDGAALADANIVFMAGQQLPKQIETFMADDSGGVYRSQMNAVYDYVRYLKPDAIIITYGNLLNFRKIRNMDAFLDQFEGIPCITVEDIAGRDNIPGFKNDNYDGMRQCISHLVTDHGYRHIAHISGPQGNRDSIERMRAFLDVMHENHLEVPETMIVEGDFSEHVETQVEYLLEHNEKIDAITCANDNMAKCVYQVLGEHEIMVGEGGIAVTGYDNTSNAALLNPGLTSVSYDIRKTCADSVVCAAAMCKGETIHSKTVPSYLVRRQSCGCKKCTHDPEGTDRWDMVKASIEQERRAEDRKIWTWLVPTLIRGIRLPNSDEEYKNVIMTMMQRLKFLKVRSSYLYMFKQPCICEEENLLLKQTDLGLDLIAWFNESEMVYVEPEDRRSIIDNGGISAEMKTNQIQRYHCYTLFHDNVQYGMILIDSEIKDVAFWQMCSLQIGTLLHMMDLNMEVLHSKKELEKTLSIINEKNKILSFISETDELTGLLNRRGFMEQALNLMEHNPGKCGSMFFVDIDHLKQINDCFGHCEGDFAIRTIADLLRSTFPQEAVMARIGGDEFVVIALSEGKNPERTVVQKITNALAALNATCEKPYYVEASVGIIDFQCDDASIEELIRQSDSALYEAKLHRRKNVQK